MIVVWNNYFILLAFQITPERHKPLFFILKGNFPFSEYGCQKFVATVTNDRMAFAQILKKVTYSGSKSPWEESAPLRPV